MGSLRENQDREPTPGPGLASMAQPVQALTNRLRRQRLKGKPTALQPMASGDPCNPTNRGAEGSRGPEARQQTLADLGEWELIRRLGAFAPPGQFADDAALLRLLAGEGREPSGSGRPAGQADPTAGGGALVVNTDVLVEGLHFSDATTGPRDVGWRAAAANLSDLAAMGCIRGLGLTVGLVAPAHTPWSWVEGVYSGLGEALQVHGGVLLGGDCSGGCQRVLAITALGQLPAAGGPIRRGDGRPDDQLVCSGVHGLSRLGLALLQRSLPMSVQAEMDADLIARAVAAHQRPVPRFDAVRALIDCRPAGLPWRLAGCDSSDGLAAAVEALAAASGCSAHLDRSALPLDPAMSGLAEAEAWCLGGGEDFELVLALEPRWAEALLRALPAATRIGKLVAGEPGGLGWEDGTPWSREATARGYSHFR
jgi:thiamine-monophosphate kinase